MTISTTTDLNSLFNNIYEDSLFVLRERTLMATMVTGFRATGYAQRKVGIFSTVSAQSVAEGVDFSAATQFQKSALATLTPGEVMAQFILTSQMMQTDDVDNIRQSASIELGNAIAEKVDTDILALFSGFSVGKGSAGSSLTIGILGAAAAALANAKVNGPRMGVLHPYQWHDIWTQLGQPAATYANLGDQLTTSALQEYFVSRLLNATWYVSANISVDGSDDAYGAIFTREALAFDEREAYAVESEYDASRRAWELNGHIGYAVGELRDAAGVYLLSDATAPAS